MPNEQDIPEGFLGVGHWISADRYLPRSNHLPVQVDEGAKKYRLMVTVSGDWRKVRRWRSVEVSKGHLTELRKEEKVEAQDVRKMG